MLNKPFQPPLLARKSTPTPEGETSYSKEIRSPKRRRIDEEGAALPVVNPTVRQHDVQPLTSSQNTANPVDSSYYNVLWYVPSGMLSKVMTNA